MSVLGQILLMFTLVTGMLIIVMLARPTLVAARGGKILAFIGFFLLPVLITWVGTSAHLENSKSTQFCLSCHSMEPYGRSIRIADSDYLPAGHYQNNRVPREQACYACHTQYTLFGDFQAKLKGMQHVYVHYLGDIPDRLELYEPYDNRECLHCHARARSFEELEDHADMRQELTSNESSCLDCHDLVHAVGELDELGSWKEEMP